MGLLCIIKTSPNPCRGDNPKIQIPLGPRGMSETPLLTTVARATSKKTFEFDCYTTSATATLLIKQVTPKIVSSFLLKIYYEEMYFHF